MTRNWFDQSGNRHTEQNDEPQPQLRSVPIGTAIDDVRVGRIHTDLPQKDAEQAPRRSGTLKFSRQKNKFCGRQAELDHLNRLFRGCQGKAYSGYESTPIVFLAGRSGCGKTALIHEFVRSLEEKGRPNIFMHGKYSHLRTADPFRAILDAISGWCKMLGSRLPSQRANLVEELGTKIKRAIGGKDLDLLTELIPGLNILLSNQNMTRHLSRRDSNDSMSILSRGTMLSKGTTGRRNLMKMSPAKLKFMFTSLIKALTNPGRPLILFLDDLQWADKASMDLLKGLWQDMSQANFLFVGAYRYDEVIQQKDHPLQLVMQDVQSQRGGVEMMYLREFSKKNLIGFLEENLDLKPNEAAELAGAVYGKTQGNIYHTMQAIDELVRKEVFRFDHYAQSWRWNLPARCEVEEVLSDSIMETINSKIAWMPELLQQALLIASYIRTTFDVDTLLHSMHTIGLIYVTKEELVEVLEGAVFEGLLVEGDSREDEVYSFAHDSIQETARELTEGEERQQLSIRLGLALSERGFDDAAGEDWMLFTAAQHWNTAKALSHCWPEQDENKLKLGRLNLKIAEISISVAAFEEAIAFLCAGIDALEDSLGPEEKWIQFYDDTMQLHNLLMDVLFTAGKFDLLEHCIKEVLDYAESIKDKGPAFVHSLGVIMQAKDRDHGQAIAKGIEMLALLDVSIEVDPDNVHTEEIEEAELACKQALAGQKVLDLLSYPVADDDTELCLLEQIARAAIYSGRMPFVYLLGQTAIRICAEKLCVSEYLPRIYMYSQMYFRKLDLTMMAYDCASTCKELIDRIENTSTEGYCKVTVTCNNGLQLCRPTWKAVGVYEECYVKAIRAGDTEFASLVANSYGMAFFFSGVPITRKQIRKFQTFEAESRRYNQPPSVYSVFQVYQQLIANLQGKAQDPVAFDGDAMTEKEVLSRFEQGTAQHKQTLRDMSACKLMAAVIFNDLFAMEILLQTLESWPDFDILLHRMNMRLAWVAFASFALAQAKRGKKYVQMSKKYLKFYEDMANKGNPNAKVVYACLQAENDQKKINYNVAIEACQESKFLHLEALMNERCGMYQRKRKKRVKAEPYLLRAHELYHAYGASGKVRQMQQELGYDASLLDSTTKTTGTFDESSSHPY